MITPSPRTASELKKEITEPLFLVTLLSSPVYLSTRGPTTYDGIVYEQAQVEVAGIAEGNNGEVRTTIRVSPVYLSTVLSAIVDEPLGIKALWGQEPFDPGDAIQIFDGVIHGAAIHTDWIDLHGIQKNTQGIPAPNIYYQHQNIQPAGTRFAIKGYTVTLEKAEFL